MLLCFFWSTTALGFPKSDKLKPTWMNGDLPLPSNNTYMYEVHSAIGSTLDETRNKCYQELVTNSGNLAGAFISEDFSSKTESKQEYVNGVLNEKIIEFNHTIIHSKGDEHTLYSICIDEYWERKGGLYYVTRLYAKSELHGKPIFDEVEYKTDCPPLDGFLRSLVPGWGQIYKGSKTKGGLIIVGEALGVGGIVASFSMKSSYEKLMVEDPKHRKDYSMSADMWQNIGYGCIAFTAAVYIYNLIDAAVAPGARRVIVLPRASALNISPVVTYDGSVGLAMKYNF